MELNVLQQLLEAQLTEDHMELLLALVDRLHDAASQGTLDTISPIDSHSLAGWLDDIAFTTQETIKEIREAQRQPQVKFWSEN